MPFDDPFELVTATPHPPGVDPSLTDFAKALGLPVGSTTTGRHNRGSKHYVGKAIDIKGSGAYSNERVAQLKTEAAAKGLKVRDERVRPKGQAVWGGPHIHVEIDDAQDDPFSVTASGGDDPFDVATAAASQQPSYRSAITQYQKNPEVKTSPAPPPPADPTLIRRMVQQQQAPEQLSKIKVPSTKQIFAESAEERAQQEQSIANQIQKHFGYSVLVEFPNLSKEKQQQIVQLAREYSTQPRVTNSPTETTVSNYSDPDAIATRKAREQNQRAIGLIEGSDIPVHLTADVSAAMSRKWRDSINPYIYFKKKAGVVGEGKVLKGAHRALASAGAGTIKAVAGFLDTAAGPNRVDPTKASAASVFTDPMYRTVLESEQQLSEAAESDPLTKPISLGPLGEVSLGNEAANVAGGLLQYAPLMLVAPEAAGAQVLSKIGLLALKGGTYSALQAKGMRKSREEIAKEAAVGGGTFAAIGLPMLGGAISSPVKRLLARATSSLIITGGPVTAIHYASGQPLDESMRAGLIMTLLRFPEMLSGVKTADGKPATIEDVKKALGPIEGFDKARQQAVNRFQKQLKVEKRGPALLDVTDPQAVSERIAQLNDGISRIESELATAKQAKGATGRIKSLQQTLVKRMAVMEHERNALLDPKLQKTFEGRTGAADVFDARRARKAGELPEPPTNVQRAELNPEVWKGTEEVPNTAARQRNADQIRADMVRQFEQLKAKGSKKTAAEKAQMGAIKRQLEQSAGRRTAAKWADYQTEAEKAVAAAKALTEAQAPELAKTAALKKITDAYQAKDFLKVTDAVAEAKKAGATEAETTAALKRSGEGGFVDVGEIRNALEDLRKQFPGLSMIELRTKLREQRPELFPEVAGYPRPDLSRFPIDTSQVEASKTAALTKLKEASAAKDPVAFKEALEDAKAHATSEEIAVTLRRGEAGYLNASEMVEALKKLREKFPGLGDAELYAILDQAERKLGAQKLTAGVPDMDVIRKGILTAKIKAERAAATPETPVAAKPGVKLIKKADIGKAAPTAPTEATPKTEAPLSTNALALRTEYDLWKSVSAEQIRQRLGLSQYADVEAARTTKLRQTVGKFAGVTGDTFDIAAQKLEGLSRTGQEGFVNAGDMQKALRELRKALPGLSDTELRALITKADQQREPVTPPPPPAVDTSQAGFATPNAISMGVAEKVNKTVNTIRLLNQTRPVRDVMAYTASAGENSAGQFGIQMRNEVGEPLRRAVGDPDKIGLLKRQIGRPAPITKASQVSSDALAFVVESGGNPAELDVMRNKITSSTKALPGWVKRATAAVDFAKQNYAKMQPAAQRHMQIMEEQLGRERAAGLPTLKYPNYIMHAWDLADAGADWLTRGGRGNSTSFEKIRSQATFADGIANGLNPKTLNALDLMQSRVTKGMQLINQRQWLNGLRTTLDQKTQKPIVMEPDFPKRADGKPVPQAPEGYKIEHAADGTPIAVHHGYEGLYGALTDPSYFSKNSFVRGLMKTNATGKSMLLGLDTFHLGRVAIGQSSLKSWNLKSPLPSFAKGETLINFTPEAIREMARQGDIDPKWITNLQEEVRISKGLVDHGYNIGRVHDMMHQEWIRKLPGIGHFNRFLFDEYQRGAMTEVGLMEYHKLRTARPDWTEAQVFRKVAKDLNVAFRNLGKQSVFKSATMKDLTRGITLAPEWNEGLIRSEVGGVRQVGELVRDTYQGKKFYPGIQARQVAGLALATFMGNQLINMYTRGHPTWENPEEDWGARLSAYIPDYLGRAMGHEGPGFFLHPMSIAAETSHLFSAGFSRTDSAWETVKSYLRSRASFLTRPAWTLATGEDALGRPLRTGTVGDAAVGLIPFGPGGRGTVLGEAANQFIPAPIPWDPLKAGLRGHEKFPGQFQKQLMSSVGIRTESIPSGEQRIRKLAGTFNLVHGVERQGDFYESDYAEATADALGTKGKEAVEDLIRTKMRSDFTSFYEAKEAIKEYFKRRVGHPLTGNKEKEQAFKKTLNPEQLQQYDALIVKRRQQRDAVDKILNEIKAAPAQ